MHTATKIATCCYCGTRAALVLSGTQRHELACSSCGAPLHALKSMPVTEPRRHREEPRIRPAYATGKPKHSAKKPKKSKRRFRMRNMLEEAFDVIEDLFD